MEPLEVVSVHAGLLACASENLGKLPRLLALPLLLLPNRLFLLATRILGQPNLNIRRVENRCVGIGVDVLCVTTWLGIGRRVGGRGNGTSSMGIRRAFRTWLRRCAVFSLLPAMRATSRASGTASKERDCAVVGAGEPLLFIRVAKMDRAPSTTEHVPAAKRHGFSRSSSGCGPCTLTKIYHGSCIVVAETHVRARSSVCALWQAGSY